MSTQPPSKPESAPADIEHAIDRATERVLVQTHALSDLGENKPAAPFPLDGLMQVPVKVAVEIGRTRMTLGELSKLGPGSVVELERELQDPVDILVNGRVVARGEVVTIGNAYGVRITSLDR